MKNYILGFSVFMMCFGGAGVAGNVETDTSITAPLILMSVGILIFLITKVGEYINEMAKKKRRNYFNADYRPKYLPR